MLRYRCALALAWAALAASTASADSLSLAAPDLDRWMYPFNATPGTRTTAAVFGAGGEPDFDDRDAQVLLGFDMTAAGVVPGRGSAGYRVSSARVEVTIALGDAFRYDPTPDSYRTWLDPADPNYLADSDPGRPIELAGVGFRNGYTHLSFEDVPFPNLTGPTAFEENESFSDVGALAERIRNAYAADFDAVGTVRDLSNNVAEGFDANAWAVGQSSLTPGAFAPLGTTFAFDLALDAPYVGRYFRQALDSGALGLTLSSLHEAGFGQPAAYPVFFMRENAGSGATPARLILEYELALPGDANADGQVNGGDFTIWADHFGAAGAGVDPAAGDFNDDGVVDGADFTVWADQFGQTLPAASVPEPASLALFVAAAFTVLGIRSRFRVLN